MDSTHDMHANRDSNMSDFPHTKRYQDMESTYGMQPRYVRARRIKCCCCIPIRVGVFMLLVLYLLSSAGGLAVTIWGLKDITWVLALNSVVYSLLIIGFTIGLVGAFMNSSRIYMSAPITTILYFVWGIVWAILLSVVIVRISKGELQHIFKSFDDEADVRKFGASFFTVITNTIFTVYYIYVFFKWFKLLKKRENQGKRLSEIEYKEFH